MPIKILMPALSPTMTEGNLAKWHKKEGDNVSAGDVIAEIETDKATMEVEAVDEGRLARIIVPAGTAGVKVNDLIAVLLEEGENDNAADGVMNVAEKKESPKPSPSHAAHGPLPLPQGGGKDRVFASPLARRLAKEAGVDLKSVKGSGPHGRVIKADIAEAKKPVLPPLPQGEGRGEGVRGSIDAKQQADILGMAYTEIPNNQIRKITAQRLQESKQTVPHFYLTIECRIDALMDARKQLNEQSKDKYKLSVNDFVVKAAAQALKAYPAANVAWTDAAILQYADADISIAVTTPNGLMTPIVKKAQDKGLKQISEEVKDLAKRARDGKLKPQEFQGGTFTVSNLGMFGISSFGAIINPPQACILAVGAGEQKPYVDGTNIRIGTFMTCILSVDHRCVDGSVGAEYLQILKMYLENPATMLL